MNRVQFVPVDYGKKKLKRFYMRPPELDVVADKNSLPQLSEK